LTPIRFLEKRLLIFATSNINKFFEAQNILEKYRIKLSLLRIEIPEIQDDNIKEIAKTSVLEVSRKIDFPIFVEDSGLFINSLSGFPGPYSAYVQRTIGSQGILRLMKNEKKREAYFQSVIAFKDLKERLIFFEGRVKGNISKKKKGSHGFGFDPIFKPIGSSRKTLGEMTMEEKNHHSHRAESLKNLGEWYSLNIFQN
jgi:XTP/dITP diphosphohydrolase